MLRLLRLLGGIMSIALQRELAYRTNLVFEALMTATRIAAGVAALTIVYTHVQTLAGWRLEEAIVLLGAYHVVSGLLETFIEPNLAWFAGKVYRGELDDMLLQPVPSLFMVSLGTCQPWSLAQVVMGCLIMAGGVWGLGERLTISGVLACVFMLCAGVVITWASRVLLASLAFWTTGFEPSVLYSAFWQLGRYPTTIYPTLVRWLLTYVIPVALVATIMLNDMLTHLAGVSIQEQRLDTSPEALVRHHDERDGSR